MITHNPMVQLLLNAGYDSGWAMTEETLTIWEHDEDPPTPLVRPQTLEPVVEPVLDESTEPSLTEETEENTETTDDQTTV
jgi:hypothetical protein